MRAAKDLSVNNATLIIEKYLNFKKPNNEKIRELWGKMQAGEISPYHYFRYEDYYSKEIENSQERMKFLEIVPQDDDADDYQRAFNDIFNRVSQKIFLLS